jgi:hypothetical protein
LFCIFLSMCSLECFVCFFLYVKHTKQSSEPI